MKFWKIASVLGLLALSVVSSWAADQAADGQKLVPPTTGGSGRIFITRYVDSTGTKAGNRDSAVFVSTGRSPVPMLVGGMYATDTTSRAFRTTSTGALQNADVDRDRDLYLNSLCWSDSVTVQSGQDSTSTPIYTAPYGRMFLHVKVTPYTGVTWMRFAFKVEGGYAATLDTTTFVPFATGIEDSIMVGATTVGNASTAHSQEFVVTIPFTKNLASAFGVNSGAYIELCNARGLPWWAPYTKVSGRLIATNIAFGANPAWTNWTVRLIGRPN